MNDAANLSKLLTHLPPDGFRGFIMDECAISMSELDPSKGKRQQRGVMEAVIVAAPLAQRQAAEDIAERIMRLCDGAGQDVVDGFREDIFDARERAHFDALTSQYERALWLYTSAPGIFEEALNAREADVFRQSTACYSGYAAPVGLTVLNDAAARETLHKQVAGHLGCPIENVAVQVFERLRPDAKKGDDIALFQVSVHYNRAPELVDCVQDSELVAQPMIRAVCTHITYEPANGHLEVLSKDNETRDAFARLTADALLQSPIEGESIPLKHYDYQSLAAPRNFDLIDASVASVKVTELGYAQQNHRAMVVKCWANDPDDIHAVARALIGPTFAFRDHTLNYVKLVIRIRKLGRARARTIVVVLREGNRCNIKTKREKDRALCDRLLEAWHLVKVITRAPSHVPSKRAA